MRGLNFGRLLRLVCRRSSKEEKEWFFVFELKLMWKKGGKISEIGREYENIVKYKCRV